MFSRDAYSERENEKKSDKICPMVPGKKYQSGCYSTQSPNLEFSDKSKSKIFPPASVLQTLSDLFENAEPYL